MQRRWNRGCNLVSLIPHDIDDPLRTETALSSEMMQGAGARLMRNDEIDISAAPARFTEKSVKKRLEMRERVTIESPAIHLKQ